MNNSARIFLSGIGLLLNSLTFGQYAGVYTVGGSNPDFPMLDSAFNSLEKVGISGNIRFKVRSGTYIERITIDSIKGASKSNSIKITPDPNNTTPVIIKNRNTSFSNNFIINIRQGYIEFDSIEFRLDSTSRLGRIFDFTRNCTNITLNACTFYGKDSTVSNFHFAILYDANTIIVNNYMISNCAFHNGGFAIAHLGASVSAKESGFEFYNNKVLNFYGEGIYLIYQTSPVIQGNYLGDINKAPAAKGINISVCSGYSIKENKVIVNGGSGYGISSHLGSGTIANNFISLYDSSQNGDSKALIINTESGTNICFNSILNANQSSGSTGIHLTSLQSCSIKNNNIIHSGKGFAHYIETLTGKNDINFNNYFTAGTYLGHYNGTFLNYLKDIQKATGLDYNSINYNVKFKSSKDLHTFSSILNSEGVPVYGVTTDIDGQSRNKTFPDIGADEFDPVANDVSVREIILSKIPICGTDSAEISVVIKNVGNNTIGNFTIYLDIPGSTTGKLKYQYTDSIRPGNRDTILFAKCSTFYGGDIIFKAYTAFASDTDRSNDTLKDVKYISAMAGIPLAKTDTICNNESYSLTTKHSTKSILRWYNSIKGGKRLRKVIIY